jgi:glycosyltransferase involved in cell wall biosynthesis
MKDFPPTISAIVPIYNREAYLAEAIASILNQSIPPTEVIVIDDGSRDGGGEIAKSFSAVRYHYQTNQGVGAARNQGVRLATGDFLAFLDSDDLWSLDKLERQLTAFKQNPHLDAVFGQVRQFFSPDLDEETKQKTQIPREVMPGYHVGTMLIRREAFFRVGWFETEFKQGEFISWYMRSLDAGLQIAMLPEIVMERRIHQTNQGRNPEIDRREYARILKASLDRRRATGKINPPS